MSEPPSLIVRSRKKQNRISTGVSSPPVRQNSNVSVSSSSSISAVPGEDHATIESIMAEDIANTYHTRELEDNPETAALLRMLLAQDLAGSHKTGEAYQDLDIHSGVSSAAALTNQQDDNEALSYEECLELEEALGDVKKEVWALRAEYEIGKLSTETFDSEVLQSCKDSTKSKDLEFICPVCLQEYEHSDLLRRLPCHHAMHICCADQWLMQTNGCPCCRKPITQD